MSRPAELPAADTAPELPSRQRRVRFELVFASVWLAIGLFALPATMFAVGGAVLGPYGDGGGLGRFYGDFFADLAEPSVRAWLIALGPLIVITLVRLVFVGVPTRRDEPVHAEPEPPPAAAEEPRRIEPRIGLD